MGKFGILIKAAAAVVLLAAAHTVSEARPGIEAGYVNAQYRSKFVASSDIADSFCMNGFFVGASSDTRLYSNKLFFNTGLYYNMLKRSEVQDLSIATRRNICAVSKRCFLMPDTTGSMSPWAEESASNS